MTGIIGFHVQQTLDGWLETMKKLPAETPVKVVNDYFMSRDLKNVNPGLKIIFRHVYDGRQHPSDNYEENLEKARAFFKAFIDGTFWKERIWQYLYGIEEWNEYLANSMPPSELHRWVSWNRAVQVIWKELQTDHPELRHIRLVCCNTAVGNTIPIEIARQVYQFGNILSYHGYTRFNNGVRDPLDFRYHSGRWMYMDQVYRANGIFVDWLSTEAGPYHDTYAGWRDERVLNNKIERYKKECVEYLLDRIPLWNKQHNNRFKGYTLFTVARGDTWTKYNFNAEELRHLVDHIVAYEPSPINIDPGPDPTPTPKPEPKPTLPEALMKEVWPLSEEKQKSAGIQLNPKAGIQKQIFADGKVPAGAFVPVQNEFTHNGVTFQAAETLDGSKPRRLYWWTEALGVSYFTNPND